MNASTQRPASTWVAWTVFALLALSAGFIWHTRDWNTATRLMLTYAVIDRGTLTLDGLETQTNDIARFGDHPYSDKNPGYSLLGLAPYAIYKAVRGLPDHPLGVEALAYYETDYVVTWAVAGLSTAWAAWVVIALAGRLGCSPRQAAAVGLAYGLGTPALVYATLSYGHQPAACAFLIALLGLVKLVETPGKSIWAWMAGVAAAMGAVIEIQLGLISALLGLTVLALTIARRIRPFDLAAFALGAAGPSAILMLYNTLTFGAPWELSYFHLDNQFRGLHTGDNPLGLQGPDTDLIPRLLWSWSRGLIVHAPVLILALPGLVALSLTRRWLIAGISTASVVAILLVNLSYPAWTGGMTTGPRFLLPTIPFLMMAVAALVPRLGRWGVPMILLLALPGFTLAWMYQAAGARLPYLPEGNPITEVLWPVWTGQGRPAYITSELWLARSLVEVLAPEAVEGLPRTWAWLSYLPLILVQVVGAWLILAWSPADARVDGVSDPEAPTAPQDQAGRRVSEADESA